jgi:hypothetical protein
VKGEGEIWEWSEPGLCFLGLRLGLRESLEGRYVKLIWFQQIKLTFLFSFSFFPYNFLIIKSFLKNILKKTFSKIIS